MTKSDKMTHLSPWAFRVNIFIAFFLSHLVFSVFEVIECLARWQNKDLFLPFFQESADY
jgi:hypothetical protein